MIKIILAIFLFLSNIASAQSDPYSALYPTYPKVRSVDTVYFKPFQAKKVINYKREHLEILFDAEGFEEQIASMVKTYRELPSYIISNEDDRKMYQAGVDTSVAILRGVQDQLKHQSNKDTLQIRHEPLPKFLTLSGEIDRFIMEKIRIGKCLLRSEGNKAPAFILWRYEEFMPGTNGSRCYLPDRKTYFLQFISSQQ